jgi:hypothetical protein
MKRIAGLILVSLFFAAPLRADDEIKKTLFDELAARGNHLYFESLNSDSYANIYLNPETRQMTIDIKHPNSFWFLKMFEWINSAETFRPVEIILEDEFNLHLGYPDNDSRAFFEASIRKNPIDNTYELKGRWKRSQVPVGGQTHDSASCTAAVIKLAEA